MEKPVSVIIPAYNHQNYVQDTIKSIINQTYQNIELIIIDDGSTDRTWQKILEMKADCEKHFKNAHFETKENEGTTRTLKKLLSLANGEYVYIIASDDIIKPSAIEKQVDFLNKNSIYSLVVGNNELIDSNGRICYWDKRRNIVYEKAYAKYLTFGDYLKKQKKIDLNSDEFGRYDTIYTGNYIPNGYLIRKSIFSIIEPFTDEAPLEDWYLMMQISKYSKMKYLDEILCSYRWHDNNTIKNNSKMGEASLKTLLYEEKILEDIDENKVLPEVLDAKKYGACYKKQGIPFVFELLTYRKGQDKIKIIKLFNLPMFKFLK